MFPGAGASVYYNEDGEPLGWDYPSDNSDDPSDEYEHYDYDDTDYDDTYPDCLHDGYMIIDNVAHCEVCFITTTDLHNTHQFYPDGDPILIPIWKD